MDDFSSTFSGVTLGLEDITKDDSTIKLFPNPANETLNIVSTSPISKVQLFNMLGQKVLERTNTNTLNVSNLVSGIYIAKIYGEGNTVSTKRFTKE